MSKYKKHASIFLLVLFLNQLVFPTCAYALTGGPSQPEVQSFEPVATSEMVDLFSGDFNYNIPLMDVGGYPINISYHSGITMDQEASWTGLGWNINPGVILRNMRSLPDDFNGDQVIRQYNIKPNETYGVNLTPKDVELWGINAKSLGAFSLSYSFGISWNSYNGIGVEQSVNLGLSSTLPNKSSGTAGLGLTSSSENGATVTASVSFSKKAKDNEDRATNVGARVGLPYNSRGGMQALSISTSVDKALVKTAEGWKNDNKDEKTGIANGGSSISYAYPCHTPKISMPMMNTNLSLSATIGGALFGIHANARISGYYSGQYLRTNTQSLAGYGYLHLQEGQQQDAPDDLFGIPSATSGILLDFNREKDGGFTEHTPGLPLTNLSYDIYSVNGQGIGGTYRPHRSDYGGVFDSEVANLSAGINLPGIELGFGAVAHPGLNFSVNVSTTTTGNWVQNNQASPKLTYRDFGLNHDYLYEPYYFKQAGEKMPESDPEFFEKTGGFDAVRFAFNKDNSDMTLFGAMLKNDVPLGELGTKGMLLDGNNYRTKRAKRNEMISTLTANDATSSALIHTIDYYTRNSFSLNTEHSFNVTEGVSRATNPRKGHHISEISAYRADGARYVYGIPAYNYLQKEVTFAVSYPNKTADCVKGLVSYDRYGSNPDNSIKNNRGIDNYFESTQTPSYAHSFLLTAVLSPDYVDKSGNGPSDDDLGNYTKINYALTYNNKANADKSSKYKWRVPFEKDNASYNEGFKSLALGNEFGDDKGSYIYGEKELWYVHSIETKNYVAVFYTSDRKDGFGVIDENGGINSTDIAEHVKMQKLDSISLFSRQDVILNGIKTNAEDITHTAIPIKTVHFEYDYSLCPGISNYSGSGTPGKLTLKKIYFTYGNSKKEKFSPYSFNYGEYNNDPDKIFNPSYNIKGYDRWGNFKAIKNSASCNESSALLPGEFPYTDQGKLNSSDSYSTYSGFACSDFSSNAPYLADLYAYAWNLTSVKLPSGGIIKVTYEADDYAFVQDKKAMEMAQVIGAIKTSNFTQPNGVNQFNGSIDFHNLYNSVTKTGTSIDKDNNNILIFKLPEPIASSTSVSDASQYVNNRYFKDESNQFIDLLYFKFLIELVKDQKEYVPGYIKLSKDINGIINCGVCKSSTQTGNDFQYGYVEIDQQSEGYQAISVAALNFMKLNLPRLAYGPGSREQKGVVAFFNALKKSFTAVAELFTSYLYQMSNKGNGKIFDTNKSNIRLYNGNYKKKGGGARVKKLVINDQWSTQTGQSSYANSDYGQLYDYTTTIKDPNNADNSANTLTISSGVASYEPLVGGEENPFRQPDFFEIEKLLAPDEIHYLEKPYGESFFPSPSIGYSKVTVKNLQYQNVTAHATGKVVHEFYTAKDFPTYTHPTPLDASRYIPPKILKFLWCDYSDFVTASQGYIIELNDMHGKPKAEWVYQEGNNEYISGVEYKYKQSSFQKLDNSFSAIKKDGSVNNVQIGVEQDFVADFRQEKNISVAAGLGGNLDAFLIALFPAVIPVALPSYSHEETRFRSSVITKVINRYGVLETTIAHDLGSTVATKNVAIDAETGEVLLTQTTNQFNDNIYNFTMPAHWAYSGMGQAYQNIGFYGYNIADLKMNLNKFEDGDELMIQFGSNQVEKYWFIHTSTAPYFNIIRGGGSYLGEEECNKISFFKIIRSGKRNQQNTPIAHYTTLANPLINIQGKTQLSLTTGILNTDVTEIGSAWQILCGCGIPSSGSPQTLFNPFIAGKLGIWRQLKSWKYLTDRTQASYNNNTNIRVDGTYMDFQNFWKYDAQQKYWTKSNALRWQFTSEISIQHPYGFEAENKDALGRYSAATYGYNNTLPTSVSGNAQYKEVGFESFEDYDYFLCGKGHFGFKEEEELSKTSNPNNTIVVTNQAHTGKHSIKIKKGNSIKIIRELGVQCN